MLAVTFYDGKFDAEPFMFTISLSKLLKVEIFQRSIEFNLDIHTEMRSKSLWNVLITKGTYY